MTGYFLERAVIMVVRGGHGLATVQVW